MYKLSKRLVTCSATTNMSVQHDTKRKKWTFDEDIVLLRQVSADLPFEASHGTIGSNWESVARTLTSCSTFGRNVNGKKCQNRFNILLDEHKILRQEAMKASGASEDETEKTQLLDDLLLRMQETEEKSVKASIAASAANRSKDLNAHHVRQEAMKTIGKRKVEELGPSKSTPTKKQVVTILIAKQSEKHA
ncbi:hypothetical protein DYB28_000912 [Aphanomyces astaci]|uniref:Myb-like domain-containing protein n=1 Tax=Aphanomyces astaci TaxID=112090 RepID=A0A9X8HF83_APHAT|nr:hypothetical protein DYB28_000912 [Aphanomyces astaci]